MTAPLAGHDVVSVLRPDRTLLLRVRATGALAVLRREARPRAVIARGVGALSRHAAAPLAGPVTVVELAGATHVLRPFVDGEPLERIIARGCDPAAALRIAAALAAAVAELHGRGLAHGAIHPANAIVRADGKVVLTDAEASHAAVVTGGSRAAFAAPEIVRGGRPSRGADVFATAAVVHALLGAGVSPFAADEPLEALRRVLHDPPVRLAVLRPGVDPRVDAIVDAGLEKRAWRRTGAARLARVIAQAAGVGVGEATRPVGAGASAVSAARGEPPSPHPSPPASRGARGIEAASSSPISPSAAPEPPSPHPSVDDTSPPITLPSPPAARGERVTERGAAALRSTAAAAAALLAATRRAMGRAAIAARPVVARLASLVPPSPLHRAGLAALPVLALALLLLPRGDAALADEVAELLDRGRVQEARARVEDAARESPRSPMIEKLRGDVACARGAPGECLRRYRVAIAARPELRDDEALRANARALLRRGQACETRRAAAELVGQLRDPDALPALEEARRESRGLFGWFCTGDALDRAIRVTRASADRS